MENYKESERFAQNEYTRIVGIPQKRDSWGNRNDKN